MSSGHIRVDPLPTPGELPGSHQTATAGKPPSIRASQARWSLWAACNPPKKFANSFRMSKVFVGRWEAQQEKLPASQRCQRDILTKPGSPKGSVIWRGPSQVERQTKNTTQRVGRPLRKLALHVLEPALQT